MQDKRLESSIAFALVRLFRLVNRTYGRALADHGLTGEQAHVLLVLWLEGPMKIGELQRVLMLGSGTLTGAIDRMERAGLVRRVPDPRDRRAYRVEPAQDDARTRRAVEGTLQRTEERCFTSLTKAERAELLRLVKKASAGLEPED